MSDLLNNTAVITAAVKDALNEMETPAVTDAPKAKGRKPKAKTEVPAQEAPKAEPAKAEPLNVDGFLLNEGADVAFLTDATVKTVEAIDAINRKDKDLLSQYLTLGMFQSAVVGLFKSTKVYGQYLAAKVPASQTLDPALRSNCKWVYEALNVADHEAADILTVLGVNRLEDFKSANPTVIRREYKAAKDALNVRTKAAANGQTVEELEAEEKAAKEADDKKARANAELIFASFINLLGDKVKAKKTLTEILIPVLRTAAEGKKDGPEVLKMMASLLEPTDDTDH